MNEIDKTFSAILKNNIDPIKDNLPMEEDIMKSVYERSGIEVSLSKLRQRSLAALKMAAVLLVLAMVSVFCFGGGAHKNGLTDYYWLISFLGIGLFYFIVTLYFTFVRAGSSDSYV